MFTNLNFAYNFWQVTRYSVHIWCGYSLGQTLPDDINVEELVTLTPWPRMTLGAWHSINALFLARTCTILTYMVDKGTTYISNGIIFFKHWNKYNDFLLVLSHLLIALKCFFLGQKYLYAKRWSLHVVRSEWLYESIDKGFCQDEKQFAVSEEGVDGSDPDMRTSTPERRSLARKLEQIGTLLPV